ncbi:MAG: hypothetical protein WB760_26385 [Xanthobacteraceae bacterium]
MDGQMSQIQVPQDVFVEAMRQETEEMLRDVMSAVNRAPDGAWINASENEVRDRMAEYRRRIFEKALQMRADAVEGAFSPGGRGKRRSVGKQGS